jgi:hypothetical protein
VSAASSFKRISTSCKPPREIFGRTKELLFHSDTIHFHQHYHYQISRKLKPERVKIGKKREEGCYELRISVRAQAASH